MENNSKMREQEFNESADMDDLHFWRKLTSLPVLSTTPPPADTLITNEIFFIQDIALSFCLIPLLCVLGMVGNLFNMVVLCRHGFNEGTNIILVSLSFNDFVFSFFNVLHRIKKIIPYFDKTLGTTVGTFSNLFIFPMINYFLCLSILHVTTIAIERFVAVVYPFYVSRIFTPFRVKWTILSLNVFMMASLSLLFIYYSYEWVYDTQYNVTVAVMKYTQQYMDNQEFFNIYFGIVLNNLLCTSPLAIILLSSLAIAIKLNTDGFIKKHRHSTKSKQQNIEKNLKVVKTLLCVCLVHLLLLLPSVVIDMYRTYVMIKFYSSNSISLMSNVNYTLYQFNASVNFIIYVTTSSKFTKMFKRTFSCNNNKCC